MRTEPFERTLQIETSVILATGGHTYFSWPLQAIGATHI